MILTTQTTQHNPNLFLGLMVFANDALYVFHTLFAKIFYRLSYCTIYVAKMSNKNRLRE